MNSDRFAHRPAAPSHGFPRRAGLLLRDLVWCFAWGVAPLLGQVYRRRPNLVVVVPPTDGGSLGDDALVLGLAGELRGREIVSVPYRFAGYGSLLGGRDARPIRSPFGILTLLPVLARAADAYVIGADVLDGRYSDRRTALRLQLATLAARAGSRASVVSFSLNRRPTPVARSSWARVDRRVRIVARDQRSAERTEHLVRRRVETAADLAFLVWSTDPEIDFTPPGDITVGFTPNHILARELGGADDYLAAVVQCLTELLERHPSAGVVLLPHDRRGAVSDFDHACSIARRLPRGRAVAASFVREPGHARWVAARLDVLVSCRMHAAVAALGDETPVVVLGYQDKAEGMMSLFGLEEWVRQPRALLSDPKRFVEVTTELLGRREEVRQQIGRHLPHVIAAAKRNIL